MAKISHLKIQCESFERQLLLRRTASINLSAGQMLKKTVRTYVQFTIYFRSEFDNGFVLT